MTKIDSILNFWFQGLNDSVAADRNKSPAKNWFVVDPAFDQLIRENFEADLIKAKNGEYQEWEKTARGRLALILLLDQFSRNLYRGSPKTYESDPISLELALRSQKDGIDRELHLIERVFLYMPLMHSEDLTIQRLSVRSFEGLVEESRQRSPVNTAYFEYNVKYAKDHLLTIERFGRFPYRNRILKRASSVAEEEFLNKLSTPVKQPVNQSGSLTP